MNDHKHYQAVLISPPQSDAFGALSKRYPIELLPLLGRPFLSRILEHLTSLGFSDIVLYAGTFAAQLEDFVGTGQRWGVSIVVRDMSSVSDALQRLATHHTPCLLGSTLQLPALTADRVYSESLIHNVRFVANGSALDWGIIREWPNHGASTLDALFDTCEPEDIGLDSPCLHINSPARILQASRDLLWGHRPDLLVDGSNADPGIFIGHNVIIHPTATLHPPVFLASDVTIGRGVSLGPVAAVETDSIIDDFSTVESSIIMPGTYVGRQLELKQSLVDRNYLAYSDSPDVVPIGDAFLIGPSESDNPTTLLSLTVRLLTLLLALAVLPLFLMVLLLGALLAEKPVIRVTDAVLLPAPEDPVLWRTFRHHEFTTDGSRLWRWLMGFWPLRGIPTLFNIICGHVRWVGVKPRSFEELDLLPDDWQQILLAGRNGLINLADLDTSSTEDGSPDQRYSSEAFYIATRSLKNDIGLLCRALGHWRHRLD